MIDYEQELKKLHLDRIKGRVALEKQAQMLRSKLDFYYNVLLEVQRMQGAVNGYMGRRLDARADLLREMVDGTLQLMRYEEMKTVGRDDRVTVNAFCQEVFENCHQYLSGDVDLYLETHLEDEETVTTNMELLQQVLTALLRCSMQFTHEGKIILRLNYHTEKKGRSLVFSVADTGGGIPADVRTGVFDQIQGTDLSEKVVTVRLRLCRAIVRLLGGGISLDTNYSPGTRIVFTIKV